MIVNLNSGMVSGSHAQDDILLDFENLTGSAHNDTLTGNTGNNTLISGILEDHASPRAFLLIRTQRQGE